jgi:Na+/proline symporter
MLYAFYQFHPLPPLATTDQIFPAFIVRQLPHGISGLVIAAIFAAAMSNLSASLNALASSTLLDFGGPKDEATALGRSKRLTVLWGAVLMAIAGLARGWGSVFTTGLSIASVVYGPMLGVFLLARLSPRATGAGAMVGLVTSLVVMIVVARETTLAWTWYVLVGAVVCASVGRLASAGRGAGRPIAASGRSPIRPRPMR